MAKKKYLEYITPLKGIPAAQIGIQLPGYMNFNIDNGHIMYKMTEHLIREHGKTKIAFLYGTKGSQEADERFEGYRKALEENGIPLREEYIYEGHFLREEGINAVREFLDAKQLDIDAIVSSNDNMGVYAEMELLRRGIKVPEEISVTGFDDTPNARSVFPELTTVHQPLDELGYQSVRDFVTSLQESRYEPGNKIITAGLALRGSCGCDRSGSGTIYHTQNSEKISRRFSMTKNMKAEHDRNLHTFTRNITGTFYEDGIIQCLMERLKYFEINHFILARYIDTDNVEIFYQTDSTKRNILPAGELLSESLNKISGPYIRFILHLHFRSEDLGFIITEGGFPDFSILEVIRDLLSGALKGAQLLTDVKEYAAGLEEKVQERTEELELAMKEIKRSKDKLEKLAVMDELTGLYNRRGFMNTAGKQIDLMNRNDYELLLVFLDLDGLKAINDRYGHKAGDTAISALAEILKKVFRKTDIIARLGGDEFTVLAIDCPEEEYERIIDRMNKAIDEYNENQKNPFVLSTSYGMAQYSKAGEKTLTQMMNIADRKLYENKRKKKSQETLQS